MKSILLSIALVLALQAKAQVAGHASREEMRIAIGNIVALHPQCTLRDIYKSCFQDMFGPGHLIGDVEAARRYLQSEIDADDYIDTVKVEPTGIHGRFVRVNISLLKDGTIPVEDFMQVFVKSANSVKAPTIAQWTAMWNEIVQEVKAMELDLPGLEDDAAMLEQLLKDGKYVMHHSRLYDEAYHPHYRIVATSLFNVFLPLLP